MKQFTITGYNRNNKVIAAFIYTDIEALTDAMIQSAMSKIQIFSSSPLRFEITSI